MQTDWAILPEHKNQRWFDMARHSSSKDQEKYVHTVAEIEEIPTRTEINARVWNSPYRTKEGEKSLFDWMDGLTARANTLPVEEKLEVQNKAGILQQQLVEACPF